MSTDNNEEKNVTEAVRKERFVSMERVMTLLYCRHVFHDFRKPVEVMYPHLTQSYHAVVKRPMDLGTLLIKTIKKEVLTIQEFRTNLQLVHKNAILFNEGAALMESISKHLELFSLGLFEETIKFPYYSPVTPTSKAKLDFNTVRLDKRRKRFVFIRDQALTNSEMQSLFDILGEGASYAPLTIEEVLNDTRADIAERQAWNASNEPTVSLDDIPAAPTLRSVLSIIISAATDKASAPTVCKGQIAMESFCDAQSEEKRAYGEFLVPRIECQQYLAALEDRIAELAVQMEERLLRGTVHSSIWAAPASMFVYAQSISMNATSSDARSRSPWWPCMIIAADNLVCQAHAESEGAQNHTSNTLGMQVEVQRANLARIPADVLKQLIKLRPRTANVAAAAAASAEHEGNEGLAENGHNSFDVSTPVHFVVPEGYLLLEYFGAHDFGWVKAESVTPMYTFSPSVDGGVHIQKNDPPGKLCQKDAVAEAAEAWSSLQRLRRKDGLYRRSALPPLASALDSAMDVSVGSSATTEEALSGTAEDEDINFASAKTAASSSREVLSQDSDSEDSDQQDLAALPSLGELEESVDIPFSAMFDTAAHEASLPAASAPAKSSSSRSGSSRSRKSLSASSEADGYFDDASGAASSSYYVPGPRKGSFVPASGQSGIYFAPEREDKRLYFATQEELLRFRANVEYVLPEDVTLEDFKNCVEEGKFKTSRCPLPLPTLQSELDSPSKQKPPLLAGTNLKDEMIIVDAATQATFRPKALLRTRALSYYLSCVRPLHLEHYTATPSKKGFPALPPTLPRGGLKNGNDGNNSDTALLLTNDSDAQVLLTAEDPAKTKKSADAAPAKPEKRKYVFKNRPTKGTLPTALTSEDGAEAAPGESAAPAAAAATTTTPSAPLPPISAANIHVPANLTLSASCFLLDAGCSRYAAGDGSVYTRSVNTQAKVFLMEAKTCTERKRILREELASLQAAIDALQQVSQQRQLRENERKIRFQQLQQQQLQQQLHQQQYAMQAQQQHQQYLMQLIDQQHQMQAQHLQAAGVMALKKGGPPKPKALKPMVPVAGALSAPKPRSRPVVVFNAAGNPTIVRTTAAGAVPNSYASSASSEGGANEGVVATVTLPAPRKKSRLGDIDLSKATILTAQQHAAEQPKHPHKRAKVKLSAPKAAATAPGSEEIPSAAHLGTPPATNALDFLASVAMESNDAPVHTSSRDELVGYKRSFGSISSPPAPMDSIASPDAADVASY